MLLESETCPHIERMADMLVSLSTLSEEGSSSSVLSALEANGADVWN